MSWSDKSWGSFHGGFTPPPIDEADKRPGSEAPVPSGAHVRETRRPLPYEGPVMGNWMTGAKCADADADYFFPEHGIDFTARGKEIEELCIDCPLYLQCREHAIRHEVFGYWAGLSPRDRKAIRKEQGIEVEEFGKISHMRVFLGDLNDNAVWKRRQRKNKKEAA